MDTIAHNGQLRTEVNIWRREILFLKKANASIRADIKRITDANHALEQSMKEIQFQHKQNEDEQEALKAMRDMEEETLREKFEAMDADPTALQMALPEMKDVDVDRAGGMHKTKEQEVRSVAEATPQGLHSPTIALQLRQNVNTTQWQMSTNSAILENEQKSQPSPKAVFDVVASQTAIESPEDFADKFLQIEAMVRAITCYIPLAMRRLRFQWYCPELRSVPSRGSPDRRGSRAEATAGGHEAQESRRGQGGAGRGRNTPQRTDRRRQGYHRCARQA